MTTTILRTKRLKDLPGARDLTEAEYRLAFELTDAITDGVEAVDLVRLVPDGQGVTGSKRILAAHINSR